MTGAPELEAMKRRLQGLERLALAGEMAASVAHEVKNPLAPIRGYAQMLKGRLDAVDPTQRALFDKGLGIIMAEADRIDARLRQLLELTRDPAETEGQVCSLGAVLADVVDLAVVEPGIRDVQAGLPKEEVMVSADGDGLRGVFVNLIQNAAEAMAEAGAGRLQIEAVLEQEAVRVRVLDEGPGLGEHCEVWALTAFNTSKARGTGLGLAIARSTLEAWGGTLTLASRTDRSGAVAEVRLLRPHSTGEVEIQKERPDSSPIDGEE